MDTISRFLSLVIAVFFALIIAGLVALGAWQIMWMQWQDNLIEQSKSVAGAEPASINDIEAGLEYGFDVNLLRVRLNGYYRHDIERYINITKDGLPGYQVITPFIEELGYIVLVDRGWISETDRNIKTRPDPRKAEGNISVTGVTRINAVSMVWSYPDADKANNIWYWYDWRGIATSLPEGLGRNDGQAAIVASLFVQLEPNGEPGIGRLPHVLPLNIDSSINHIIFAFVSFFLATLLAAWTIYFFWFRRNK